MYLFLKFILLAFVVVCITGCPRPDSIKIIMDRGESAYFRVEDSGYIITLDDIFPFRYKKQKKINVKLDIINKTKDAVNLVCSKSMIYSKTDTFTWKNTDFYGAIYLDVKDTVALVTGDLSRIDMLFEGKKKYSGRSFRRTNKKDTLYFLLNIADKFTLKLPMRNHHVGAIWNTY
jgi:hypothetical protein